MALDGPRLTVFNTCRSCLRLQQPIRQRKPSSIFAASPKRAISSTALRQQGLDTEDQPRWRNTPPRMTMPVRSRPRPQGEFKVNSDPRRLDDSLASLFGNRGRRESIPLSEDVKWLAVTHKSYDHGRRGFNDRLAFLGKRIVDLQASLALLESPAAPTPQDTQDQYGREVYSHPNLKSLDNLSQRNKAFALDKNRLANLAKKHSIHEVIRWKPKQHSDLPGSGLNSVLAQTMYSIVGALALENGGSVANKFVKQRILGPLGL